MATMDRGWWRIVVLVTVAATVAVAPLLVLKHVDTLSRELNYQDCLRQMENRAAVVLVAGPQRPELARLLPLYDCTPLKHGGTAARLSGGPVDYLRYILGLQRASLSE